MKPLDNPPNPYESACHEWLEPPPAVQVEVYEEEARSILSENDSPDVGFRWSVNPYRGCQHACIYCYARPWPDRSSRALRRPSGASRRCGGSPMRLCPSAS